MKTWIAILFSIGLFVACIVIYALFHFNVTWIMVLGTSLWAAIDSSKIQLKRYKSGISYGPVALFFACALLWIVGFPWYLTMRYKIKTGTATLKDEIVGSTVGGIKKRVSVFAVLSVLAPLIGGWLAWAVGQRWSQGGKGDGRAVLALTFLAFLVCGVVLAVVSRARGERYRLVSLVGLLINGIPLLLISLGMLYFCVFRYSH